MAENYPIGIQTFSEIVRTNSIYVDKTELIFDLLKKTGQKNIFLSRPRRFGKSLLISTFKSIFEGKQEQFKGLYIYDKIDWEAFPIIHLSMTNIGFEEIGLAQALKRECGHIAKNYGLTLSGNKKPLRELLELLYEKYQKQVVILIDEYDKPITHGLEANDSSVAEANRDIMKAFYSGLKDADMYLRFLFITGISKFTKVSIFSELNNLIDISLHKNYTTLCGYTQAELEHYFPEGLKKLADENNLTKEECIAKVEEWYDGFSWDGKNFVYNPFSTLLLLNSGQFDNYWFASGTPTFLVKKLNEVYNYDLTKEKVSVRSFDTFNLRQLNITAILLQTGYLTLKKPLGDNLFLAGFPNKEVEQSFNEMLLAEYVHQAPGDSPVHIYDIKMAFLENNVKKVLAIIESLFASTPSHLFSKMNDKGKVTPVAENFYHAVIYLIFTLLGVKIQAEVAVREGRIDAVVETEGHVYLFEFKKNQNPDIAIAQMEANNYSQKYILSNKKIHLIGVSFSLRKRGLDKWKELVL